MSYTCMIVDDEPLAHTVLLSHIKRYGRLRVAAQCFTAEDARSYLSRHAVDILFLDIEMPEETGIDLLRTLPKKPLTIFTTAYLHYTLEGFELGVIDYLVKPVRYERFALAVDRAVEFLALLQLRSGIGEQDRQHGLLIKIGNKKVLISRAGISHVQALKDYAIIFSAEGKFVVRSTMKEMEELLGADGFMRVHKSFIIAKSLAQFYGANKIEFNNFEIPVGRKYRKRL